MPLDPVRAADTRAWLEKAVMDLRSAEADLAINPPILGDALFHCQQAVEKALKAFLTWHDRPFRKTHDLVELGGRCVEVDSGLEALLRSARTGGGARGERSSAAGSQVPKRLLTLDERLAAPRRSRPRPAP